MPRTGTQNQQTKAVGEFLVCAELGRREITATTFAGNVKDFDRLSKSVIIKL
jgi:hypothetical protein